MLFTTADGFSMCAKTFAAVTIFAFPCFFTARVRRVAG